MSWKNELVRVLLSALMTTALVQLMVTTGRVLPFYLEIVTFVGSYIFCLAFAKVLTGDGGKVNWGLAVIAVALMASMFFINL